MLSDAGASALRDIQHHIDLAMQFVAGFEYEAFGEDTRTVYAVTRCLEVISEASRRLPDEIKNIAVAGNIYRHDYEEVAAHLIWDTVNLALPPSRAVVSLEIAALK